LRILRNASHGNCSGTFGQRIQYERYYYSSERILFWIYKKEPEVPILINNPSEMMDPTTMDRVEEPFIKASIITKSDFVGSVMTLCIEKRGEIVNQSYLTSEELN
jgi:translation elongation factor EF-4